MLLHFDKAKFFSYESWYTNVVNLLLLRIYYSSCINFHFFSDLSHRHIMLTKLQFIYIFRDIKIFSRSGDIFGLEFLCLLKFIVIRIYYYTKEIKDNNIWKIYVMCIIRWRAEYCYISEISFGLQLLNFQEYFCNSFFVMLWYLIVTT